MFVRDCSDVRDGEAGFWSQKPNPSPSGLDLANKMWGFSVLGTSRVPHRYGNTCGVSKTGNAGTVTVLIFGAP